MMPDVPLEDSYCAIAVASLREWIRDAFVEGAKHDGMSAEMYADLAIRSHLDQSEAL